MEGNFKLVSDQLGKNEHSKVYILQENNSKKEFIVKIYEESKLIFYKNETNILKLLNNLNLPPENNFFIMFKDMQYNPNMFKLPEKIKENNLEFLFYDYLPKLSLLEYISEFDKNIPEKLAKFLCYKLLKAIEKLHNINICHNNIEPLNIMLDNDFNVKLIHFSEGKIVDEKNKYRMNKDLFCLGQALAKILTKGTFLSINYNIKNKLYLIYYLANNRQKAFMQEKIFWNKTNFKLSKEFLDFFHILISAKKSKELIDINELLQNEWLKEVINDTQEHENIFKYYFSQIYQFIIDGNEAKYSINIDINDFIYKFENVNNSNDNFIFPTNFEVSEKQQFDNNYNNYNNKYFMHIPSNVENELQQNNIYNFLNQEELNEQKVDNLNYYDNEVIGTQNFFKPKKDNFNHILITIENNYNKYLKESVLINFMQSLKIKIKEHYKYTYFNLNFSEEEGTSFIIYFVIDETYLFSKNMEFLDESFENKIKNIQKFKIKVELVKENKDHDSFENLKEFNKNEKYYLIFSGDCLDKEDFCVHVNEIKILSYRLICDEKEHKVT